MLAKERLTQADAITQAAASEIFKEWKNKYYILILLRTSVDLFCLLREIV